MTDILNKKILLNLLDMVDSSCKIRLMVSSDHINVLERESYPYFYTPKDSASVRGIVYLSIGAGKGEKENTLTLCSVKHELDEDPSVLQESSLHIPLENLKEVYAVEYNPLTKNTLMSVISETKEDELIRVLVDISDIEFFNPEPQPYLLPDDIAMLKKRGTVDLCIGTLINRDYPGITLMSRSA